MNTMSHRNRDRTGTAHAPFSRSQLLPLGCAAVCLCAISSAPAANWPNWRGPDGTLSTATGSYPVKWTVNEAAWKLSLPGKGTSTPIVWNERIYLTTPADGEDAVMAVDFAGREVWRTKVGPFSPAKHRTLSSSCNASPVTDGKTIFAYFRSGHLLALNLDGSVRWQQNLTAKFGPEKLFWDQGSSPVLSDQAVILARMHNGESWVAGFDKTTGALRWQVARNYSTPSENDNGYTTPVFCQQNGHSAFLVWGAEHLTAHDTATGRLLWSAGGFNPAGTVNWPAIASPVVQDNIVVIPVGRDDRPRQSQVYGIRLGGSGDVSDTHRVWKREDVGVFVTSLAASAGRVYLLRHRGEVVCLDPVTGKTFWTADLPRAAAPFYASPVIANGVLYAAREDGVVFTARVGKQFELISENPMGERLIATPVPAANRLFLRGDNHLFCITTR